MQAVLLQGMVGSAVSGYLQVPETYRTSLRAPPGSLRYLLPPVVAGKQPHIPCVWFHFNRWMLSAHIDVII